MSAAFDPYYQWLSIPPEEQPPHHYRLLGVKLFEQNLDVIDGAADRQMKHLRDSATGKHAADSQRLLAEVSAARVCLLDAEKKAAYDAKLQAAIAKKKKARQEKALPVAAPLPEANPASPHDDVGRIANPPYEAPSIAKTYRRRGTNSTTTLLIAGGVLALLLVIAGGAAIAFWPKGETLANNPGGDENPNPPIVAPPPPPEENNVVAQDVERTSKSANEEPAPNEEPIDNNTDNETEDNNGEEVAQVDPPEIIGEQNPTPQAIPAEQPDAPSKKLPVPAKEVRDQRRAQIAAIFPVDASGTFAEKGELVTKLIRTARETKNDPAGQFALLNLAREQAAAAGQIKLAFEAIDLLEAIFEFDADLVRVASLETASKAAIPPADKRDVVTLGMQMVSGFVAADEFDKAKALGERLVGVARPVRDAELLKTLAQQRQAVDALATEYRQAQAAFETLKQSPDDPAANLAAGRYLTFAKQDWQRGLAHLAKSSDAQLSAAAKLDLANPQPTADQEKLADAWWTAAQAEKETTHQNLCRARGGYWYRQAAPKLSGLAKVKAENRIREAGEFTEAPTRETSSPLRQEVARILSDRSLLYYSFERDSIKSQQQLVIVADQTRVGIHGQVKGPSLVEGKFGGAFSFDGVDDEIVVPALRAHLLGEPTMTVLAWFKPEKNQEARMFSIGDSPGRGMHLALYPTEMQLSAFSSVGGSHFTVAAPEVGKWHHVAAVIGGGKMLLYLDGELKGQRDFAVTRFDDNSLTQQVATIGGQAKQLGRDERFYKGLIDEFVVLRRVLTPEEIKALYRVGIDDALADDKPSTPVEPDLGIFSRDPSEFQRPRPPDSGETPARPADEKLSDDDLRKLLVGHVWRRTTLNDQGIVLSDDAYFAFETDGSAIARTAAGASFNTGLKTWLVRDGALLLNQNPRESSALDLSRTFRFSYADGKTHVFSIVRPR